jgi:hypothetical protein
MNRGGRGKWSCVRHCYGAGSLSRFLGDPDRYFCDLTTIYMLLELNLHGLAYRTFPAASSFRRVVTRLCALPFRVLYGLLIPHVNSYMDLAIRYL